MEDLLIEINKEEMDQLRLADLFELRRSYKKEMLEAAKYDYYEKKEVARRCHNILTGIINERKRNLFIF